MFPDITAVRHLRDHQLELTFADGTRGTIDFADLVLHKGGLFTPLEDVAYFSQVTLNPDIGTIVWPNDVDFDPEVLYSQLTGKPIPGTLPENVTR